MLLEREAALASLPEYASEARRGEGRLVLIAGEAGIGKSTLLDNLHEELPAAISCSPPCYGSRASRVRCAKWPEFRNADPDSFGR